MLDGMFWAKTSILQELNIKTWPLWSFNDLPFCCTYVNLLCGYVHEKASELI